MSRIALRAGAKRLFILALAVAGGLAQAAAAEERQQEISALTARIEALPDRSRLLFDLTGLPPVTAYPVANPPRIIVDLPQVLFRLEANAGLSPRDKLIKSYRYGMFAPGRSRVVIDLAVPAKILKADSEPAPSGPRLVIELAPTSAAHFAATAEQARRKPADPTPILPPQAVKASADKPMVVIDPGHGGLDMGATGKHGELEKDVVLEFALALRQKIEAGGRARVLLTRDHDMFLPLAERVRIARENNASLFVSVHADTLAAAHVEGATVYTASERASDAEAARMAEKENLADQAAGLESSSDADEVGDILFELTRRETRSFSRQFSHSLISFWKEVGAINKNPNRSAGFVVLKAYDVPSVLLELGYLSSDRDLARLTSQEWRERAAQKTAEAVDVFISKRSREARAPADDHAGAARPQ
ncbi:MAG: N-acetylmuramoyl-L-alanine amidase [Methylocystis sp.]